MAEVYGTVEEVAVMASTWTEHGEFDNPTEVQGLLEQVSAQFNIALGSHYFVASSVTEIDTPNAYKSIAQMVIGLTADLVAFKHSTGRYFSEKMIERGTSPTNATLKDINSWIELNSDGLVADGVEQIQRTSVRKQAYFRTMS